MAVKHKMYKEVQLWKSSGKSKADFILDKEYSPIATPAVKNEKLIELDLPSGIKITVYK